NRRTYLSLPIHPPCHRAVPHAPFPYARALARKGDTAAGKHSSSHGRLPIYTLRPCSAFVNSCPSSRRGAAGLQRNRREVNEGFACHPRNYRFPAPFITLPPHQVCSRRLSSRMRKSAGSIGSSCSKSGALIWGGAIVSGGATRGLGQR